MVGRTTLVATIGLVAMLALPAPRRVLACVCCACDFGRGDVECGDGDADCGECIVLGGVPAPTCDVCADNSDCTDQTLCAGDQQMCSIDVTGGCCVAPEFGGGCFLMTGLACANLGSMYRGDGTDCTAPCPLPNGASCTTTTDCASTFCVDSVCCDTACTDPAMRCNLAGQVGTCTSAAAAAPTLTPWGLIIAAFLLTGVAGFALRQRMRDR